jgi:hypothetical protein
MGRMVRRALVPAVLVALAGCGGGSADPPDERPTPERRLLRELRSPDARSPFVTADGGAWRCRTGGRLQLAVSADGEVSVATPVMVLASVAPTRALVNRACSRAGGGARSDDASSGRVGALVVRCRVPEIVVVDLAGGDVIVRAARGRYVAGASVPGDRIGVAGYWGDGCAPVTAG